MDSDIIDLTDDVEEPTLKRIRTTYNDNHNENEILSITIPLPQLIKKLKDNLSQLEFIHNNSNFISSTKSTNTVTKATTKAAYRHKSLQPSGVGYGGDPSSG